ELAVMAWPRSLIIENARVPEIEGPPAPSQGRSGAAPGRLGTPGLASAKAEWERARSMLPAGRVHLQWITEDGSAFKQGFSREAIHAFGKGLKIDLPDLDAKPAPPENLDHWVN